MEKIIKKIIKKNKEKPKNDEIIDFDIQRMKIQETHSKCQSAISWDRGNDSRIDV